MIKHTIPILIALLAGSTASAQEVIASSGETRTAGNLIVSQTVGEVATVTVSSGTIVTQGFQQGDLVVTSISEPREGLEVSVYPNPFVSHITVRSEDDLASIEVTDAAGSLVRTVHVGQGQRQTTLELDELSAGQYLLLITSKDSKTPTTYHITKH